MWTHGDCPIFIGRTRLLLAIRRAMDSMRSGHDQTGDGIAIVIRIGRLTCIHVELSGASDFLQTAISIRRRRRLVEEHHDRGPIEPRSRRDRAAIVNPSAWNQFRDPQTTSKVDRDHDQTTITARSWLLFEAKLKPMHR